MWIVYINNILDSCAHHGVSMLVDKNVYNTKTRILYLYLVTLDLNRDRSYVIFFVS